VDFLKAPEKY
jgi:AFG3 family protein